MAPLACRYCQFRMPARSRWTSHSVRMRRINPIRIKGFSSLADRRNLSGPRCNVAILKDYAHEMLKATRRGGPTTPGEPGDPSDIDTQMIPYRREKRKPVLPRGCFALRVPLTAALGLTEDAHSCLYLTKGFCLACWP